jgi:hypothetical protein
VEQAQPARRQPGRCLVQIARVLNGGSPDGPEWHRVRTAGAARFRHLVRHLYAYELRPEPVERLRVQALALWPAED